MRKNNTLQNSSSHYLLQNFSNKDYNINIRTSETSEFE